MGWSDSIVGRELGLHVDDLGQSPAPHVSPSPVRSYPWVQSHEHEWHGWQNMWVMNGIMNAIMNSKICGSWKELGLTGHMSCMCKSELGTNTHIQSQTTNRALATLSTVISKQHHIAEPKHCTIQLIGQLSLGVTPVHPEHCLKDPKMEERSHQLEIYSAFFWAKSTARVEMKVNYTPRGKTH